MSLTKGDMNERVGFVSRLEAWRVALGLPHRAFARHLGISGPYWRQLRTGIRRPSRDQVKAILEKAPAPWKSDLERAFIGELSTVTQ
jgi:transcriptional regulator with XRE-family HTH domain